MILYRETMYGVIQVDQTGKAVPGSVFRFVEFPGASAMQVEILSGLAQGMCRLIGNEEEASAALTGLGLLPWESIEPEEAAEPPPS